jgi:GrpB-like predicted nucleotidyltransferase (UPF0157 family)
MLMITIVPYDEQWPLEFARLAEPLQHALDDLAVRIDHIGSTAVPGLAAKDVIDMQVTVRTLSTPVETALATLGYERVKRITADHHPPNTTAPDTEWEKWFFRPPAAQRRSNLHVRVDGRANQRYPLLFRDYLRTHLVARDAYAIIKQQLARYHPEDEDAYYDIKDPVCDIIWSAAEEWAHSTNWQPGS